MPRFGNGTDLARELGISRQAVSQAVKAGRISRTAAGTFDLDAAAIQYGLHTDPEQQRRGLARQGRAATSAVPEPLGTNDYRIRQARVDAERAEIELEKMKGGLADTAGIESTARSAGYAIVGALEQLPDRVSAECGTDDAQRRKIRQVLLREIDQLRGEIAAALKTGPQ